MARTFKLSEIINETSHNDTAAVTINPTGANNSMTYTATSAGSWGNEITVAYVDPGTETATETVTVTGTSVVVTLRSVSSVLSTAAQVKTAWDATAAAVALATVANAGGDTGAGVVTAISETSLTGGSDYVYSDTYDLSGMENINGIQMTIDATTLNGLATLDVTMQFSYDKVTWFNGTAFTQLTTTEGNETKYINGISAAIGPYIRFRFDANTVVPVKAALSTALTGNNNDLDYTAVDGGAAGNKIKVAYVDPGVAGATLSVDVATDAGGYTTITFNLATTAKVAASYTTTMAGANNDIVVTAVTAGTSGNAIDFTMVDPSANSAELSVDVSGTAITVNLATNGSGTITSTANQVIAAMRADLDCQKLVSVALSGSDTGAGVVTALSKQDLSSGSDGAVISSTGDLIKAALLADSEASALVTAADKSGNDGSGVVTAMTATALTGGADNIVCSVHILAK
jgi:hypothetical protein